MMSQSASDSAAFEAYRKAGIENACQRLLGYPQRTTQGELDSAHAHLAEHGAIARDRAEVAAGGMDGARARLRFAARSDLAVRLITRKAREERLLMERSATAVLAGESLPLGDIRSRARIATDIATARSLALAEVEILTKLQPARIDGWKVRLKAVRSLGFRNEWDRQVRIKGVCPEQTLRLAQRLLDGTRAAYQEGLRHWSERQGVADHWPFDAARLFHGAGDWDIPEARTIPERVLAFLQSADLGLGDCILDTEDRSGKTPRPFTAPLDPPHRVLVSIRPSVRHRDTAELLHELGHAVAFSRIDPTLSWEGRLLWHDTVQESFAFLMARAVRSPRFVREILMCNPRQASDYAAFSSFLELYLARRHAARVIYESALHEGAAYDSAPRYYAAAMEDALLHPCTQAKALEDLSEDGESIDYLWGWALAAGLAARLGAARSPDWVFDPVAWDAIRPLWAAGGNLGVEALTDAIGLDAATLATTLVADFNRDTAIPAA